VKILIIGADSGAYGSAYSMYYLLRNLVSDGNEVIAILPDQNKPSELWDAKGITVKFFDYYKWIYIPQNWRYDFAKGIYKAYKNIIAELKIYKYIKQEKPDIVHINSAAIGFGALSAIFQKRKLIWHFREFVYEDLEAKFHWDKFSRQLFNKADARVCVSNAVKEYYEKKLKKSCKTIYNGVDIERFFKERQILCDDEIKIIFPGRLQNSKGQLSFVKALGYLKDDYNYKLYIYGDGEENYVKDIKKEIECNALVNKVMLCGFTKDIASVYRSSDVVIVNSTKEAFGRTTVEAMMAGCLVVGYDAGGTSELLAYERGILYRDLSKLDEIFDLITNNKEKARKIAFKGQKFALNNFTDKLNEERILEVYKNVL